MQVENSKLGQILTVRPRERRLDASSAAEFKSLLMDRIQEGNDCIILDLSDVSFVDSSALGAMVSSMKALGSKGEFVVCGIQGAVQSLFNLTRMDRVFQIFQSTEEALRALSARRGCLEGMENAQVLNLQSESKLEAVPLIAAACKAICATTNLRLEELDQLEMCVVEALTHTVNYAYGGKAGKEIGLKIFLSPTRVSFHIHDSGKSLEGADLKRINTPLKERDGVPDGGMGLYIIRSVMEDVSYRTESGGNVLTMTKYIS